MPPDSQTVHASEQPTRGAQAYERLIGHFFKDIDPALYTPDVMKSRMSRLLATMGGYHDLSQEAQEKGMTGDSRFTFIREGLQGRELLPRDEISAVKAFGVISLAFELNRPFWEAKLEEQRRQANTPQGHP